MSKPRKQLDTDLTDADVVRRRDDAVRRALNTPPKPHKNMKKGKGRKRPDAPATSETKP